MWGVGGEEAIESTIDTHPPPRLALYISAVFLSFAFARCFRTSLSLLLLPMLLLLAVAVAVAVVAGGGRA